MKEAAPGAHKMNDTESNRVATKSKRGRKPAQESRSVEIRQRIAEWKSVPHEQRKPITELARDLGISHQLASHYASQVPWPDPVAEARAHLRAAIPRIMEMCMSKIEKRTRERGK